MEVNWGIPEAELSCSIYFCLLGHYMLHFICPMCASRCPQKVGHKIIPFKFPVIPERWVQFHTNIYSKSWCCLECASLNESTCWHISQGWKENVFFSSLQLKIFSCWLKGGSTKHFVLNMDSALQAQDVSHEQEEMIDIIDKTWTIKAFYSIRNHCRCKLAFLSCQVEGLIDWLIANQRGLCLRTVSYANSACA